MKKKLMGLIVCLIGFGMGFLSLLYSNEAVQSLEKCTRKVVNPSIKDKKDCRLSIWQVKNEQEFMEIKELVHREHFNDCYGYMKYREEPLASMQFYVISEMNWSGNQEVAQWKYYSNGDFIDLDDTELRTKLLVAKNAENINWQL